ncbi:hypothetical protein [Citrobacter sp. CK204]|uniref:hypothetical protein n=1 Tax=Citrobacter sp. CK204 TaxID=2985113 RepID=UPI002577B249|nr:hypothetical protein [Citrobacter sp. CK204]MDM3127282.1 hypothetical protein [Citrobacter sp. CK204]
MTIDKQTYHPDGGDISTGRLREIADNPYGDEEKCWLAKRVLALLDALEALQSFRTAYMEWSDKTDWVQTDKRLDVIKPWGKHRADVLKLYIDHLESKLEAAEHTAAVDHEAACSLVEENEELKRKLEAAEKRIAELEARAFNPAILDVIAERQRQQSVEGWTPEHDDEHSGGEMALAASSYALYAHRKPIAPAIPFNWPWEPEWFKQQGARRDLVKAGALILAEIERIDRAAGIGKGE